MNNEIPYIINETANRLKSYVKSPIYLNISISTPPNIYSIKIIFMCSDFTDFKIDNVKQDTLHYEAIIDLDNSLTSIDKVHVYVVSCIINSVDNKRIGLVKRITFADKEDFEDNPNFDKLISLLSQ